MKIERSTSGMILHAKLEGEEGLKPCPFCGSTDLDILNTRTPVYWIKCYGCGAEVPGIILYRDDTEEAHRKAAESAIERWNLRVESMSNEREGGETKMGLRKAIEILSDAHRDPKEHENPDLWDSIKLAIHALEFCDRFYNGTIPGLPSFLSAKRRGEVSDE